MKAVKEKARILHRDIGVGNVMFRIGDDNKIQGVLSDWDNNGAVQHEDTAERKSGFFRTVRICGIVSVTCSSYVIQGIWHFMSIDLLRNLKTQHEFRHDVESIVLWVPFYMILRYLKHTKLDKRETYENIYEADLIELPNHSPSAIDHLDLASALKYKVFWDPMTQVRPEGKPLDDYLWRVIEAFLNHYTLVARTGHARNPKIRAERQRELAASNKQLNNPDYFLEMFGEDAFNSEANWPVDDKTEDQFPPVVEAEQDMDCYESASSASAYDDHSDSDCPRVAPPAERPASPSPSLAEGVESSPLRGKGNFMAKQPRPVYSSSPIASSSQGVKRKRSASDESRPPKTNKARGRR